MKKLILSSIFIAILLTGCKEKKEVSEFTIPKEKSTQRAPIMPEEVDDLNLTAQTEGFSRPEWQTPINWQEKPAGAMRKGSFSVKEGSKEAEISVLAFPGNVGGILANINRWAGQIGNEPLSQNEIDLFRTTSVSGLKGIVVDMKGSNQSIYGVIVERGQDSWFFKMMGDIDVVNNQKKSFDSFIESVKFK